MRGRFGRKRPRAHGPDAFDDWRSPFERVDAGRRLALGRDLAPIVLIAEPRWRDAAAGNASAAISITLERLWCDPVVDIRRDLILSALWLSATAGDPASCLLLRAMRERIRELTPS